MLTMCISKTKKTKEIFHGKIISIYNEGIREYFGAEFMREMGIKNAPKIELIRNNQGTIYKIVSYKVGSESLGGQKKDVEANTAILFRQNPNLKREIMKFHAISFLMGNRDLHVNNIMIQKDDNSMKLHCAPIDFGLSGHNMSIINKSIIGGIKSSTYKTRFDTNTLKHSDANLLFTDDEFKPVLRAVLQDFEANKEKILNKIFHDCKALGVSNKEIKTLKTNIKSNCELASNFVKNDRGLLLNSSFSQPGL